MTALTPEQIKNLLDPKPIERQTGRIRWYDKEMRCVNKYKNIQCNSPTYIKLDGEILCMMHALKKCNELLEEVK